MGGRGGGGSCRIERETLTLRQVLLFLRSTSTQLLLWPSFKLSPSCLASSPLLRPLVFTSHTHSGYAHITHHVYPLQSPAHTSAELGKISSTVTAEQETAAKGRGSDSEERKSPTVHQPCLESAPTSEFVCWTEMPRFLLAYIPRVSTVLATQWNWIFHI